MSRRRGKVILIILDGVGIGALPDAHLFNDRDANTLKNISLKKPLDAPNLGSLGLGNIEELKGISPERSAKGFYGKMAELSKGKDSTTGHWEIAGIVTSKAFPTFPDGFPPEMIDKFKEATGVKEVLGNRAASGTTIIEDLGEEHLATGYPIVYTSADSVFQVAAHVDVIPLEKLYDICEKARKVVDEYNIGRVIARPFEGKSGADFKRIPKRKDYSVIPPKPFLLSNLEDAGIAVIGIGKIDNLFADVGVPECHHTSDNLDGIKTMIKISGRTKTGLIFANLIDFDMLYGHRRDHEGFHRALREFDDSLPAIIRTMSKEDLLIITADHGTDPTTPSTDHSREFVPLIAYTGSNENGKNLKTRKSFADVGQTVSEYFGTAKLKNGVSFSPTIWPK